MYEKINLINWNVGYATNNELKIYMYFILLIFVMVCKNKSFHKYLIQSNAKK